MTPPSRLRTASASAWFPHLHGFRKKKKRGMLDGLEQVFTGTFAYWNAHMLWLGGSESPISYLPFTRLR